MHPSVVIRTRMRTDSVSFVVDVKSSLSLNYSIEMNSAVPGGGFRARAHPETTSLSTAVRWQFLDQLWAQLRSQIIVYSLNPFVDTAVFLLALSEFGYEAHPHGPDGSRILD